MIPALFDAIHADPWARELVDLATLNAGASGAVEQAVEKLRQESSGGGRALRSVSLVILGPPGAGKTHLFARLRRRVGPRAVFVHVRPLVHAELTPRFLLGEVVRQLSFQTPQGMSQASALICSVLGALSGMGSGFPSAISTLYTRLPEAEREERLDAAIERILSLWPEADEVYLRRLLHVPFSSAPTSRALLAWLSGRDCDVAQLERIGAATSLGEDRAMAALQTLSLVAALGAPLVIVFDQLENLMDGDGAGPRLRAYAHLASDLVDVLRGSVLVHLALDSEWDRGIEPSFNASQRSRIVMRRELLSLPRASEREELLRLLLERLPEPRDPFPWPFGEKRLEWLRTQPGITPRLLLVKLRAALEGEEDDAADATDAAAGDPAETTISNGTAATTATAATALVNSAPRRDLADAWQTQLAAAREAVHVASEAGEPLDAARLADGLLAAGRFIPGLRVATLPRAPAALTLDSERGSERLALVQESNHKSVGAALAKLTALSQTTRVVVVRERARELPPTWRETRRKQSALLQTGRARWLDLDTEDGARLLAIAALLQAARSGEVTDARGAQVSEGDVSEWVTTTLDVASWPISVGLCATEALAAGSTSEALDVPPATPEPDARPTSMRPPALALSVLRRLRVASLDRLIREVSRLEPASTRASILTELEAAGSRVRWFGRSLVCLEVAS